MPGSEAGHDKRLFLKLEIVMAGLDPAIHGVTVGARGDRSSRLMSCMTWRVARLPVL
ncbi:MAG: hypothetical protein LDL44_05360 [Caenispirillum sp.]|nr:hypothetical protein [Caenispirillum sp.]